MNPPRPSLSAPVLPDSVSLRNTQRAAPRVETRPELHAAKACVGSPCHSFRLLHPPRKKQKDAARLGSVLTVNDLKVIYFFFAFFMNTGRFFFSSSSAG